MTQAPASFELTEEQMRMLPDLVSFAMVGASLLKNAADPTPVEKFKAIAAFYPHVQEELEERKRQADLEMQRRYFPEELVQAMGDAS